MINNYFKIAFRNLSRHKLYSAINILGLAVGMAACILILLWVKNETSYDRFHSNADDLYRISQEWQSPDKPAEFDATTPVPLEPVLKERFPEIIKATRFDDGELTLIKYDEQVFQDDKVALADPDFFEMFSFPLIKGDIRTVLSDDFSVVVSEKMSSKYFGDENPLGKTINIDRQDFTITGVMKDLPQNSHMQFDCLCPFSSRPDCLKEITDKWELSAYYTYIQLHKDVTAVEVNKKIANIVNEHDSHKKSASSLFLQPITQIHLYHHINDYLDGHGDIKYVYLFSALAFLILFIACINFMNLTTARYSKRTKEVGIRKVNGAYKTDLIRQFFGEAVILSFVALLFSLFFVELLLPLFNSWSGKELGIDYSRDIKTLLGLVAIAVFTGIISGSYPAIFLSAFSPVKILKGNIQSHKGGTFRKVLVICQFSLSIFLMISASVIVNQLNYMKTKELGFNKDQLISIRMQGAFQRDYKNIKSELLQSLYIKDVTAGVPPIRSFSSGFNINWEGKDPDTDINWSSLPVDYDYIKTFQMKMLEGRDFIEGIVADSKGSFILNETATKVMGIDSPVGKRFSFSSHGGHHLEINNYEGTIIGVVKNFNNLSLHKSVEPVIMYVNPDEFYYLTLRFEPQNFNKVLTLMKTKWDEYASEHIFEYTLVDETIDDFYKSEKRLSFIFNNFTILAIFISCLGLFGLASFTAEQRTKEIGIRKIMGASVSQILSLLSQDFVKWVMFANIIAIPVAYFVMNKWLQNFAYKVKT